MRWISDLFAISSYLISHFWKLLKFHFIYFSKIQIKIKFKREIKFFCLNHPLFQSLKAFSSISILFLLFGGLNSENIFNNPATSNLPIGSSWSLFLKLIWLALHYSGPITPMKLYPSSWAVLTFLANWSPELSILTL